MKPYICVSLFVILFTHLLIAQETDSIPNTRENALNIFIDCNYSCDMNFIKNNITMVNYVRTVQDADVYVRVAPQSTGSGGSEVSLFFEGQNEFEEQAHKIIYTTEATSTSDERRIIMVKNLKAGLLPFIAQTPFFDQIEITYDEPENKVEEEIEDKWNNWVYSVGVDGYFNGDSNYKGLYLYGNLSARRVTEKWKLSVGLNGNYNSDKFITGIDEDGNPEFVVIPSGICFTDHHQ